MLKKYRSLSSQAEDINTKERYKELIDVIKQMSYVDMFELFYDANTALDVLLETDIPGTHRGIQSMVKDIVDKGQLLLSLIKAKNYKVRYTYNYLEPKNVPVFLITSKEGTSQRRRKND